ncbi:host specificity protein J [Ralstonia nicotianae]
MPQGSKGGESNTPTQAPDSLSSVSYAQILDLISEGPIYGPPSGDAAQSCYINDVPLKNPDGTFNFVTNGFDFRYGDIDQAYIPGFDSAQQEIAVNVPLTYSVPWNVVVTDLSKNAIIITLGVNALSETDTGTGDVRGYRVAYQVQLQKDNGVWQAVVDTAFDGKCSSAYQRSHRISLGGATQQYSLRVVRQTSDATSSYVQDKTSIASYTLVVDAKLRYPLSALAALSVDAVQFSSVPNRSYDMKGLLVSVPSNYDPITRVHSGAWDGTFVKAWTDNPAWIFYDLVLNARYGLGTVVDASMVDRYALYQIARYCDELVGDGKGGKEPRFTCNCYIQTRADAYKVLQDLASIFRGMAYWSAGSVVATSDMPQDPAYLYTAANVIGGEFKYVGAARKTRYTCAVVTWNNPDNGYKAEPEYVEDPEGIARYGINRAQVTAFGCTSRGQAQRVGQWMLITSRYETNVLTFAVGLDGTLCQPGQIIAVADPARSNARRGGRVRAAADTARLTLDKVDPGMAVGDSLTVVMPQGGTYKSVISRISGNAVTVDPLAAVPVPGAIWVCESATLKTQLFRVLSVAEKDGITFEITATQHEPGKYAAIDSGAVIDVQPVTSNTFTSQQPPSGVTCSQYVVTDQGIAKTNLTVSWQAAPNAVSYRVQFQKDNGTWIDAGTTGQTSIDVSNIYAGLYLARVSCTNGAGVTSPYAYSAATRLSGKTTVPPVVATLTATTDQVFAVTLNWSFPQGAGDTAYTEVYYSHTGDFTTATLLGRYSYPTTSTRVLGLVAGYDLFFWARLVDTTGNVGGFYPATTAAGVHGMSTMDASAILGYLSGQITSTQLSQDLLTPIQAIPSIETRMAANETAVSTETSARVAADAALSSRIDSVTAFYLPPEAGSTNDYAGSATSYAGVWSEQYARAAADGALATRVDTVEAKVNAIDLGPVYAAIQTETNARVTGDSANASQITTLQASARSNSAAIQTNANAYADLNGRVAASYTVKMQVTSDGKLYTAGYGLGIDNSSGVTQSQFLVTADRFAVLETVGNNLFSPFVIQNGQAFINQAFIGNAWITNAMIANASIDTAKIQSAAIATAQIQDAAITGAKIQSASITNAHIQDASITAAKIGSAQVDTLQIAGDAVTVPRAASSSSGGANAVSVYMPATGAPVIVIGQAHGSGSFTAALRKDGSGQLTLGGNTSTGNCSAVFCYLDTSGAAGTYYLDTSGASTITGCTLIALGCKR